MSRVNNVTTSRSKLVIGRAPKSHAKDVAAPFWEQSDRGGGDVIFLAFVFLPGRILLRGWMTKGDLHRPFSFHYVITDGPSVTGPCKATTNRLLFAI